MNDPKIPGGYYIKARAIQKSNIMRQPPHVREIWDYLLMNANHSDRKYGGYSIKRGQLFRTYKQIREDLSWNVGWRKETYNENQTKKAMKFLREALMIDTTKEPGGVLITICNYEFYQDPRNYERTSERTSERTIDEPSTNQPAPYNKNGNNKIMGKDNIADSVPESANLTIEDENDSNNNEVNDNDGGIGNGKRKCICDGNQQAGIQTLLPGIGDKNDKHRAKPPCDVGNGQKRENSIPGIGEQGTPQGSGCGMEGNEGSRGKDFRTGNGDQNCKHLYGSDETYGPSLTGCGEEDKKPGNGEGKNSVPDICLGGGDTNTDRESIRECGGKISGDAGGKPEEPKYRTKKNRWLKGQRLADFEEFWIAFDYKKGKAAAADSWLDIKDYSPEKAKWIIYAAKKEAWERDGIIQRGGTPKWCQGWLTDRRWEDYPMEAERSKKPARTKEQIRAEVYAKYGRKDLQEASTGTNGKIAGTNLIGENAKPPGPALQILFGG